MGQLCDFCGEQRSMVYCRSDAAYLCLSCDRNIHSANALSKRHSRTLVCERCSSQPATVRCIDEKVSLCQNCDWSGHTGSSSSSSEHKKQTINCYSGCPSSAELSRIWSFISNIPAVDGSTCDKGFGSMSITDKSDSNSLLAPLENSTAEVKAGDTRNKDKKNMLLASASFPPMDPMMSVDLPSGSSYSDSVKPKGLGHRDDDFYYRELRMDDIDFENYDELFGGSKNYSQRFNDDGGMDGLFGVGDIPGADLGTECAYAAEGSSAIPVKATQPTYSNPVSVDSIMSCKTDPNLCFPRQSSLSLSFSGLTGESSNGDYQDCVVSPMLLMGKPPWHNPCPDNQLPSAIRDKAVLRYREKKRNRMFDKKVRYASRKARADVRKRVKGRFVKAGDAYDYDPLCQTRNF